MSFLTGDNNEKDEKEEKKSVGRGGRFELSIQSGPGGAGEGRRGRGTGNRVKDETGE